MPFDARLLTGVGVFAAVAEAGNFAKAAKILGLTPSGVSRSIARLETRIGVRLFDRNSRVVTLTEEGRRFHARAMPLLAGLEEAAVDASGASMVVSGRLRVSIDPWFARMVVAPRLPEFMARYPKLFVELTSTNYREDMMLGVDVAVRFGSPDVASLIVRKLLETPVITCASPGYIKRCGEPQTPHDLIHHEVLLFRDPQTGRPFQWQFQRGAEIVEVEVAGRVMMDDPTVALEACLAGQGVFQSLAVGLAPWLSRGDIVQILPSWCEEKFPLYAYHPSRALPPAKVTAFLNFIQAIAGAEDRRDAPT
ncbi:LysR family transcriptional regulator [Rhizobium sp. RCC_161_2]|uniref:LysR family transcriptional regulator n=1 Tax=Rhizobium sp. RCC_161_2 TaxID=3239219 RepID=UPI0035242C1E